MMNLRLTSGVVVWLIGVKRLVGVFQYFMLVSVADCSG
jgi:hypothetical protein